MAVKFFVEYIWSLTRRLELLSRYYAIMYYWNFNLFRIETKWTLLTLGNQLITEKIDSIEPPQVIGIEHDKPVNLIFNQEFPAHNRQWPAKQTQRRVILVDFKVKSLRWLSFTWFHR